MNIGKRIKEIRVKNNVTQRELAEKLGLTLNTVSRYETGERRPRIDTVIKIAKALGVKPSDLFTSEQRAFYELFDDGYGDEMKGNSLIRFRNARSRHSGAAFEELVNCSCDYYEEQGIAKIEKIPEPMKVLANLGGGLFKAVFTKQAQPDYKGTIYGGQCIVFDAKHTDTDRIKRNVVTEEQEKCLDAHERMGAECFVLVSFGFEKFYRIPWGVFRDMKSYFGHQYISRDDERLKAYEVKCVGGTLRFLGNTRKEV